MVRCANRSHFSCRQRGVSKESQAECAYTSRARSRGLLQGANACTLRKQQTPGGTGTDRWLNWIFISALVGQVPRRPAAEDARHNHTISTKSIILHSPFGEAYFDAWRSTCRCRRWHQPDSALLRAHLSNALTQGAVLLAQLGAVLCLLLAQVLKLIFHAARVVVHFVQLCR